MVTDHYNLNLDDGSEPEWVTSNHAQYSERLYKWDSEEWPDVFD